MSKLPYAPPYALLDKHSVEEKEADQCEKAPAQAGLGQAKVR